jgi:hypothetical protein
MNTTPWSSCRFRPSALHCSCSTLPLTVGDASSDDDARLNTYTHDAGAPTAAARNCASGDNVMRATAAAWGHCNKALRSPEAACHTLTLPSPAAAATSASSLDHARQQAAALLWPASTAIATPDDVLHRRMLPSEHAAATTAELGLKCTLVTGEVLPVRQAMAVCVCKSHRRSEWSFEPEEESGGGERRTGETSHRWRKDRRIF